MSRRSDVAAVIAALLPSGCSHDPVHLFGAYRYDPEQDCLEQAAAVDVIAGESPGQCSGTRCWTSPAGDVYVTTEACDAPEGYIEGTTDAPGSLCARALGAFANFGGDGSAAGGGSDGGAC